MRRRSSSETYSDVERKKEKRRIAWMIAQAKEREHERLKRKKIEEYERKRAEQLKLNRKQSSTRRSHSKSRSRSKSEERYDRRPKTNKSQIMSEKLNSSSGSKSIFKGPDEPHRIDISELQKVKVKIHRKIPAPTCEVNEIRRVVVNPEEITLKRREGEGSKPIFDRKELTNCHKSVEVEEHRTVEAVGKVNTVNKRSETKPRSKSLSPRRHRTPSPYERSSGRSGSRHSRYYSDLKGSHDDSRRRRTSEERSYSKDRDYYKSSKRDYERREKDHREYSSRYRDYSHDRRERRDRDSSRERNPPSHAAAAPPAQYLEQMPFPVYYGGFAPRPMLLRPSVPPIRGPMMRGRVPTPIRPPFPPRYIGPQDMYRVVLPHDPRYGQMY